MTVMCVSMARAHEKGEHKHPHGKHPPGKHPHDAKHMQKYMGKHKKTSRGDAPVGGSTGNDTPIDGKPKADTPSTPTENAPPVEEVVD